MSGCGYLSVGCGYSEARSDLDVQCKGVSSSFTERWKRGKAHTQTSTAVFCFVLQFHIVMQQSMNQECVAFEGI